MEPYSWSRGIPFAKCWRSLLSRPAGGNILTARHLFQLFQHIRPYSCHLAFFDFLFADPFLFCFLGSLFLFVLGAAHRGCRMSPSRRCPSSCSKAYAASSFHRKVTKANPRLFPLSSWGILTLVTSPKRSIKMHKSISVVAGETFMKIFLGYRTAALLEEEAPTEEWEKVVAVLLEAEDDMVTNGWLIWNCESYSRKQPCLAFWVSGTTEGNARFDLESCILAALERLHWRNLTWLHAIHNLTAGFPWKHAELTLPTHSAVSFRHC